MATATRKIFVNWFSKVLQVSDTNGGVVELAPFYKYETVPFDIVIVEPNLEVIGFPRWNRVDISNLSIRAAINDTLDTASPLSYQPTFTKDESSNVFSGELDLNTSALNTWIGSSSSKSAYFEIELQEGTAVTKIYQALIEVKNSVVQIGVTSPSPVDSYLTTASADQQYARKVGAAGEQFTITSPGGVYQRVFGVDDGGNAIDQILPV